MVEFTENKFLGLPLERQHKKCAELLRHLYDNFGSQSSWNLYLTFLKWMGISPPENPPSIKDISDYYHFHLKKAHVSKKEHNLLPDIRQGDRETNEEAWPIAIYLDNVRSAYNVGSMIRTTESLRLGTLYFSLATPPPSHKQVKDAAMGCEKWITCVQGVELDSLPRPIIALETAEDAISLYDFIFPETFTLVVGNEEYGCSDHTLALADYLVEIPLRGRKNSLNVANAFAVAAGEICRQKHFTQGQL